MAGAFVQEVDRGVARDTGGFPNKVKELCCVKDILAFGVDDNRRVEHADNVFMTLGLHVFFIAGDSHITSRCSIPLVSYTTHLSDQ
jgi:hypothetical protein